ncbi:unnamed protein product [Chrysoparadoxa australica]
MNCPGGNSILHSGLTPGMAALGAETPVIQRQEEGAHKSKEDVMNHLRQLAVTALQQGLAESAAYYADKVVSLGGYDRSDVLLLARAYSMEGKNLRVWKLLVQHGQLTKGDELSLDIVNLAALSLYRAGKHEECLNLLEDALGVGTADDALSADIVRRKAATVHSGDRLNSMASLCCLRGRVFADMDNRDRAAFWLKTALRIDARCVEALQILVGWHLLNPHQQAELLHSLSFTPETKGWLSSIYSSMLDVHALESHDQVANESRLDELGLGLNAEVLAKRAERCYLRADARSALAICEEVIARDPHNSSCLPVYIMCMVELSLKTKLFYLAHKLTQAGPHEAIGWFAVGCHYLLIRRCDQAQRFLLKATKLDPHMTAAWIGFGNAFAEQDESDQAVSAYRTAARRFPGSHFPLLYIGMEHLRTNHLSLAGHFLSASAALCSDDPLVHHEQGVVMYRRQEWAAAAAMFERVVDMMRGEAPARQAAWESTYINLGHCYRKQRRLSAAADLYSKAVALCPNSASAQTALAFLRHVQGLLYIAVELYHRALVLEPENTFAVDMLERALQESLEQGVYDLKMGQEMGATSAAGAADKASAVRPLGGGQSRRRSITGGLGLSRIDGGGGFELEDKGGSFELSHLEDKRSFELSMEDDMSA